VADLDDGHGLPSNRILHQVRVLRGLQLREIELSGAFEPADAVRVIPKFQRRQGGWHARLL
jgi:hypothetical protein